MQVKRVPNEHKSIALFFMVKRLPSPNWLQSSAILQNLQVILPLFVCLTESAILASPWQRICTTVINRIAAKYTNDKLKSKRPFKLNNIRVI